MSNMADTSLDAFRALDVTHAQKRILAAFSPGLAITRQELVTLTGMPINSVSGRCTELLEAGVLESLPTVEGRHPLRLTNAAGHPKPTIAAQTGRSRDIPAAPQSHDVGAPAAPIGVIPTLFSRDSLSVADAKRIYPSDKANAFYDEAKRVVESGPYRVCS